jgi:hypothetical protein
MPLTSTNTDKLLIEISEAHYYSMLRHANEVSPLYFRLKNSIKTETGKILIPCDATDAEMLRGLQNTIARIPFPKSSSLSQCKISSKSQSNSTWKRKYRNYDNEAAWPHGIDNGKHFSRIAQARNRLIKSCENSLTPNLLDTIFSFSTT